MDAPPYLWSLLHGGNGVRHLVPHFYIHAMIAREKSWTYHHDRAALEHASRKYCDYP